MPDADYDIRKGRPKQGGSREWRFFKTAAGPDETEYPEAGAGVNVYYARELKAVTFPKTVGAQTLSYTETSRYDFLCNLEPEKYIEEGAVVLCFLENGQWWTIDKTPAAYHVAQYDPAHGMRRRWTWFDSDQPGATAGDVWVNADGSCVVMLGDVIWKLDVDGAPVWRAETPTVDIHPGGGGWSRRWAEGSPYSIAIDPSGETVWAAYGVRNVSGGIGDAIAELDGATGEFIRWQPLYTFESQFVGKHWEGRYGSFSQIIFGGLSSHVVTPARMLFVNTGLSFNRLTGYYVGLPTPFYYNPELGAHYLAQANCGGGGLGDVLGYSETFRLATTPPGPPYTDVAYRFSGRLPPVGWPEQGRSWGTFGETPRFHHFSANASKVLYARAAAGGEPAKLIRRGWAAGAGTSVDPSPQLGATAETELPLDAGPGQPLWSGTLTALAPSGEMFVLMPPGADAAAGHTSTQIFRFTDDGLPWSGVGKWGGTQSRTVNTIRAEPPGATDPANLGYLWACGLAKG